MPIRKRQQLDINLASIKDAATRAALSTLVEHVSGLTQDIIVSGGIESETIKNHNGKFKVLKSGKLECDAINTAGGGSLKMYFTSGSIDSLDFVDLVVTGTHQIIGVIGFATRSSTLQWRPISYDYPTGQGIVFEHNTDCGTTTQVRLRSTNSAPTENDLYRVVIFYVESGTAT